MPDELTIEVKALIAEAEKNLAIVGQQVQKLGETVLKTAGQHEQATAKVKAHHESLKQFGEQAAVAGEHVLNLGERMEKVAQIALGGPAGGVFGMWLGGMGAALAIAEIVKSTVEWHTEIARLSQEMNNNVQAASVWVGIADELKIPVQDLEVGFRTLSERIDMGSKALHEMGIATVDEHGKLLPLNTVLQESQKWFHEHAGSSLAAARASELFGRAGQMLLPILSQDASTFQAVQKELQELGLVMDATSLQKARQMDFEMEHLKIVVQGLTVALGEPLIHALAILGGGLSQAIVPHLEQIKQALASVVNFIAGVIYALTGWRLQISETAQALGRVEDAMGSAGSAADTLQNSTAGAADAARALREATKDQVDAIQEQIRALEEQDRVLQDQSKLEHFQDQQITAAERKQTKLNEIARLQSEYEVSLREGNLDHASQVYDQLLAAKQAESDAERQDQLQLDDFNRQQQMDSNQQQIQLLQDRQRAIQQAAQDAEAAMAGAAQGMSNAIVGAAGTIDGAASDMQTSISDAGTQAGENFGNAIKSAIGGIITFFQESESDRDAQLTMWGQKAGEAFGQGIIDGLWNKLNQPITIWHLFEDNTPPGPRSGFYRGTGGGGSLSAAGGGGEGGGGGGGAGLQGGGFMVPGPFTMPRMVRLHGDEMVLNPGQQASLFALLSGTRPAPAPAPLGRAPIVVNATFNIYGASDPQATADVVNDRFASIMGVK